MIERPKRITKKWRIEEARKIIDRNIIAVPFGDEDLADFLDVCRMEADGIKRMKNPQFPSDPRHVHALLDGEWAGISWRDAIQKPDPVQKVKRAMRHVVSQDLLDFRSSAEPYECWKCGALEDITVDHVVPPFDDIANAFIESHGLPEIGPSDDATVVVDVFSDAYLEELWYAHHAENACYQLLCRSCNASKGKRQC